MPDFFDTAELSKTLVLVQSRITNYRGDRTFNEERTKASIIEPVLRVLGWDTNDPEDVDREYKPKSRDNPVDYALLLRRWGRRKAGIARARRNYHAGHWEAPAELDEEHCSPRVESCREETDRDDA